MADRLKLDALEDLAVELRRAAEREQRRARRRRGRWVGRPLAAVIAVAVAGSALAGGLSIRDGGPMPSASPRDFPADQRPLPGSTRVTTLRVKDPAGGLPFGLGVADGRGGRVCLTLGRVLNDDLGVVQGSKFREHAELGAQTCVNFTRTVPVGMYFAGPDPNTGPNRVMYGAASDRVAYVEVTVAGRTQRITPGPSGAFLTTIPGTGDRSMVVRFDNGCADVIDEVRGNRFNQCPR